MPRTIYVNGDGANDWETLRRGGPNGFFVVMLAFWWWGAAEKEAGEFSEEWMVATADLRRCLERMAVTSEKRPPETVGEVGRAEMAKRRKRSS